MSKKVRTFLLLAGVTLATSAGAAVWSAKAHYGMVPPITSAPEIDAAAAASGLTLLSGVLLMLRGRRSKK